MLSSDGITGPAIPTPDAQEFKTYSFQYSLFPHRKGWKESDCYKPAYEFSPGLSGFHLPASKGKRRLPFVFSFVRFFETKGQKTTGVIHLYKEPVSVKTVNLLEKEEGRINHRDNEITLKVKPFEIVSLKIRF